MGGAAELKSFLAELAGCLKTLLDAVEEQKSGKQVPVRTHSSRQQ